MANYDHVCSMITINKEVEKQMKGPRIRLEKASFDGSKNKTFLFLLPKTGFEIAKHQHAFINCFADTNTKKASLRGCVYILCRESEDTRKHIKGLPGYVYDYYIGYDDESKYFMYCININDDDYDLIVSSKYSKTSDYYKEMVRNYIYDVDHYNSSRRAKKIKSKQYSEVVNAIVNKEDWLREDLSDKLGIEISPNMEYWAKFDSKREYFKRKKQ